ncbi:MAG: hypothetical protein COB15_05520 [Flavobacteriales bacterium]|nr:MAG: hypothetical protein COB15_05520 [Flavobacteriales bacterium]
MKRRILVIVIYLLLSNIAISQNLVPNGGFETYTSLPNGYSQFFKATGWTNVNGNTTGAPYGSPDYYHTLGSVPTTCGPILPNSGNGQMGFFTYFTYFGNVDAREYTSTQLTNPLISGQQYQISFYLTNGNGGAYTGTVDNFGIHLSVGPLTQAVGEVIQLTPTIEVTGIISNQNYWQQYIYTFVATNAATDITFGNFEIDSTTTIVGGTNAYYFIDDIELVTIAPLLQILGDTSICMGDSTTLLAINDNIFAWADSINPMVILSTDSIITVAPTVTTTYFVYGTNDSTSIKVNVYNFPMINLNNKTSLCQGETLTLDVTTTNATYLWQDNSTNPTFNVTQQGTYWVEVTENNCTATDTILVNYNPLPSVNLGNDATLCQGETLTLDATTPNATYLWQDDSTSPTLNATQQGSYWVEVTVNNCSTTDTILVNYNPLPSVNLGNDATLCQGETLTLDATTPNATYLWQDTSTSSTFNVTQQGTYWVEVTDNCGSTSDTIIIDLEDCNCTLYVPNSFTPNTDGKNDQFSPIFDCDITEYTFIIFNRWGELIFETNTQNNSWSGSFKGKLCPTGVYIYILKYRYEGIYQKKYGNVNLLK